jgi:hypothetical protein
VGSGEFSFENDQGSVLSYQTQIANLTQPDDFFASIIRNYTVLRGVRHSTALL